MSDPSGITIRPARPADAPLAAELVQLSMGEEADLFFGGIDRRGVRKVIAELFLREGGRFSLDTAAIAEVNRQPAGLLLAYGSDSMPRRDLTTGRHLLGMIGLSGMVRLLMRLLPLSSVREAERGEYYIGNLAVQPRFQGRGIGTCLLAHVEALARAAGLVKCSLLVAVDNHAARRLYERVGYQIVATKRFAQRNLAAFGFHRMVKQLDTSPAPR